MNLEHVELWLPFTHPRRYVKHIIGCIKTKLGKEGSHAFLLTINCTGRQWGQSARGTGEYRDQNTMSAFGEVIIPSVQLKFKLLVGQKCVCFIFVLPFQQYTFAFSILLMAQKQSPNTMSNINQLLCKCRLSK